MGQHSAYGSRLGSDGWKNEQLLNIHLCSLREKETAFYIVSIFTGEELMWDFLYEFGKCWEVLFLVVNLRLLFPPGPQDWSILRNIKKQCSDYKLLINLFLALSFFICLLLFPLGSKEVLYLRNDSLLLGRWGLWTPHNWSSIFKSSPHL